MTKLKNKFCSDYEAASHLAEEYKDEIALQGKLKRNLEITIPEKIIIGPFIVNIADLKNFLVNKNYELYRRMLESFADRQRAIVENVCSMLDFYSFSLSCNNLSELVGICFT